MSEKKLDNEEFRVVGLDNLEVIKGDANKLKLLITSYATIMEVQDAYIQKELDEKKNKQQELEEKVASGNLERNELKDAKKDLSLLKQEVRSLEDAYREFSEARQRFLALAKKALKLPKENFEQLAKDGWIEIEDIDKKKEVIDLQELSKAQEDAQNAITDEKDNDIFSSVDSNLIKEEVEKMMNRDITSSKNYGDTVARNIDADNFDETVSEIAEDIKNEVDERKANEVTPNHMKDLFTKQEEIKQEKPTSEPEQDEKANTPDSPTIAFNIPSIAGETGEWTPVQPPATNENKSFEGFDSDTSIADYISKLEEETQEIKASREKTKDEKEQALQETTEAEKARDKAKAKSEKTRNDVEEFKKYMPRIKEAQEAKRKEEEALKTEMAELASINLKKTALETEIAEYDEETRKSLEELREIKAILNGEEPEPKKEDLPKNVIK